MLCRVGSSDRSACVDGELAALVRRFLSDSVSEELVPGSYEVESLLKASNVDELPLRPISDCAAVEHLESFFVALNKSTKAQVYTAVISLVSDVVVGVDGGCIDVITIVQQGHVVPTDGAEDSGM